MAIAAATGLSVFALGAVPTSQAQTLSPSARLCPVGTINTDYCLSVGEVRSLQRADAAAITRLLRRTSLAAFLRNGGLTLTYSAPGGGTITLSLATRVTTSRRTTRATKSVTLTRGVKVVGKGGKVRVKTKLTAAGRKLVRSQRAKKKPLRVVPTLSFKAKGSKTAVKTVGKAANVK